MAGFLGVITRLRNPLLAPLRDSPKPRPTGVTRDDIFGSWVLDPGTWDRHLGSGQGKSHMNGRMGEPVKRRVWWCSGYVYCKSD